MAATTSDWIEQAEAPMSVVPTEQKMDILVRSGGAYIPPAKLRRMQEQLAQDKNSDAYQRLNWELLKKHINGQVNKVNVSNIVQVVRELLQKNVIRGMGLLASTLLKAQTFSPSFSHVYAALVAIINSKFPNIGQLILKRLVIQFKRAFRTNNKALCVTVSRFIAHLANQRIAHEILILEILVLLMDKPTDDSIEVAVTLLKECGEMLSRVIPKGLHSVFERLRSILEDADTIDTRTQQMIEIVMAVRKDKFKNYPSIIEELDLIDEEDQISHIVELSPEDGKPLDPETSLNYYKYDPDFEQTEEQYEEIRQKIIGDADDSGDENEEDTGDQMLEDAPQETPQVQKIIDMTEQDMVAFRRNVYLAIQSSLDYQEAAHKLIKYHLKPGLDSEMCHMIVDCCAQQRTYERFYGLLTERFCRLRLEFQQAFELIARNTYTTIHRFDIKKIRIMAQLISHLLATDAIDWSVLSEIKMNENDTSSAGRVYVKIMFQELAEAMGQKELFKKLYDPTISMHFEGLLPRDHPKNTRFAINFFTLCGLGGLTVILREHYEKKMKEEAEAQSDTSSSSSSDSDSSSTDSDDSSSSSSSSDSESEEDNKKSKENKRPEPISRRRQDEPEIKQEIVSDEENQGFHRRSRGTHQARPDSPQVQRLRQRDLSEERALRRIQSPRRHDRRDRHESSNLSPPQRGRRSPVESPPRKTRRQDRHVSPVDSSLNDRRRKESSDEDKHRRSRRESPGNPRSHRRESRERNRRDSSSPKARRHDSSPPEIKRSPSPKRRRIRSPERRRSRSPERRRSRSPERRRIRSPERRRSRSSGSDSSSSSSTSSSSSSDSSSNK